MRRASEISQGNTPPGPPDPEVGLGGRLLTSGAWGMLGQAAGLLISFVATPFVIRWLGTERYGLLAFVNLTLLYMAFSDFGMAIAATRFGAQAMSGKDPKSESAALWTAFGLAAACTITLSGLLGLGANFLVSVLFEIPPSLREEAAVALRIVTIAVVANALGGVFVSPQMARLRNDLNVAVSLGAALIQASATLLVLGSGWSLSGVAIAIAAAALLGAIANTAVSARLAPQILRPSWNPDLTQPLLRFGFSVVVMGLTGTIIVHGEKFLLLRFGSVRQLAYYNIAFTFGGLLGALPMALAQPMMPAFVHAIQAGDRLKLGQLYYGCLRALLVISTPLALILALVARPFFTAWAGAEFGRESVLPLLILAFGWVLNGASYVPRNLLSARGELDLVARLQAVEVVPYFVLSILLIRRFGASGAALAWTLRTTTECVLLLIFVGKRAQMEKAWSGADLRRMTVALAALLLPPTLASLSPGGLALALPVGAASIAAYGLLAPRRLLTAEEKTWIRLRITGSPWRSRGAPEEPQKTPHP